MKITRFQDAKAYDAPKHHGMVARRLQGLDVSSVENFSVGFSTFQPGGGAERSSSPTEKVYVVVEGKIQVTNSEGAFILNRYDSCHIGPGEERTIVNTTDGEAKMLVISPNG
jgi:quercetin dioxygenase-like cupin family protein